jgi:hypothetical protein
MNPLLYLSQFHLITTLIYKVDNVKFVVPNQSLLLKVGFFGRISKSIIRYDL